MKNIIIYLISINIIGFLIMWIDKRKAIKGSWRIPEKTLFIITAIGGGIGTIAGMYIFRHKTKKLNFIIGLPLITILEIILGIYYLITKQNTEMLWFRYTMHFFFAIQIIYFLKVKTTFWFHIKNKNKEKDKNQLL